jgi:hypothetical protein
MPSFIKSILLWITGYAWLALIGGIGILGYAGYSQFKASTGTAYTAADQLSSLSGKVVKATEVTVTSKSRKGRTRGTERYYEIEVKPEAGDAQKLRINLTVGPKKLEAILDEKIAAKYDAESDNLAYEITMGGKAVLSYDETKATLQASADAQAKSMGGAGTWGLGVLLLLVGAGGMWLKRKLSAQIEQEEKQLQESAKA